MIPEFPLPTVDADFYKSKMHQWAPVFGHTVLTPQLAEPTTFLNRIDSPIVESLRSNCLHNAVKRAAIHHRNLVKKPTFATRPNSVMGTVGSLTAAFASSLVITQ